MGVGSLTFAKDAMGGEAGGETPAIYELPMVPRIVSLGMRATAPHETWDWHTHPFDEICLVVNDGTTFGFDGRRIEVSSGSAMLCLRGERHGFWNSPRQAPDLWVVHFEVDPAYYRAVLRIDRHRSEDRLIRLEADQLQAFFGLFVKVSLESAFASGHASAMASAWLQLLIASVDRWIDSAEESPRVDANSGDPELVELWETLSRHITVPFSEMDRLSELIPNYDSLRHRFKRTFGVSPRTLLNRMRMQLAQNLLLEGRMSIKEVAHAVGYWRQHEFARAFRRHTSQTPREFRRRPR